MIDVKQEAEDFWMDYEHREGSLHRNCFIDGFILGTNSKYVQAKVLQAQINALEGVLEYYKELKPISKADLAIIIGQFNDQLKKLQNDNLNP